MDDKNTWSFAMVLYTFFFLTGIAESFHMIGTWFIYGESSYWTTCNLTGAFCHSGEIKMVGLDKIIHWLSTNTILYLCGIGCVVTNFYGD